MKYTRTRITDILEHKAPGAEGLVSVSRTGKCPGPGSDPVACLSGLTPPHHLALRGAPGVRSDALVKGSHLPEGAASI